MAKLCRRYEAIAILIKDSERLSQLLVASGLFDLPV